MSTSIPTRIVSPREITSAEARLAMKRSFELNPTRTTYLFSSPLPSVTNPIEFRRIRTTPTAA
ncbi:hypothetical protein [Cryobacterium ruanii]|uniref:Uncharacterized protein n=1 Tax=Cryobacterium ruanii TaxID=1259197 RepID=A0A4R9AQQ5_9MICO|nr:hypothetical protein [Cryobacterium ruanii]TFD67974.1 hypothetical protein E3T47_05115 [Cryobacterium ruanii]